MYINTRTRPRALVNIIPNTTLISSHNYTSASSTCDLSNQLVLDSEVTNNSTNSVISNKKIDIILNAYTLFHENSITNPLLNNKPILADKLRFIISKYHVSHYFVN